MAATSHVDREIDRRQSRSSLFERTLPNDLVQTVRTLSHCRIIFNSLIFKLLSVDIMKTRVSGNVSIKYFSPKTYFPPFYNYGRVQHKHIANCQLRLVVVASLCQPKCG